MIRAIKACFLVFFFFSVKLAGFHDMHDVSGKESRARELSCVCVCVCVYSASQFHLPKLDNEAVMEDFFLGE